MFSFCFFQWDFCLHLNTNEVNVKILSNWARGNFWDVYRAKPSVWLDTSQCKWDESMVCSLKYWSDTLCDQKQSKSTFTLNTSKTTLMKCDWTKVKSRSVKMHVLYITHPNKQYIPLHALCSTVYIKYTISSLQRRQKTDN